MSDVPIKVEGLGKKFSIAHQKSGDLRSSISEKFSNLFGARASNHEEFWALKDVSFEIKQGEAVGIIGRNGAGKSTLLKILSRITDPSAGRFEINGRVSSLLEVGTGFHAELTGRENIYLNGTILGMKRKEIKAKFDEIVAFSGVEKFLDTPVKHYSSGMKVRLAFSVAAHLEPEILIIDEVLAVGDAEFQKKCLGKMDEVSKSEGRTIVFVSHNLAAVKQLCPSSILLKDGKVRTYSNTKLVLDQYNSLSEVSEVNFKDQIVNSARVYCVDDEIHITLMYRNYTYQDPPSLGFLIGDSSGNIIFGSNPKLASVKLPHLSHGATEGNIEVVITEPKLLTGRYSLSLFLGDGSKDFFLARDCLSFYCQSANTNYENFNTNSLGVVIPKVKWNLS